MKTLKDFLRESTPSMIDTIVLEIQRSKPKDYKDFLKKAESNKTLKKLIEGIINERK